MNRGSEEDAKHTGIGISGCLFLIVITVAPWGLIYGIASWLYHLVR